MKNNMILFSLNQLLKDPNIHIVENSLFVCQELAGRLQKRFKEPAYKLLPAIFDLFNNKEINNQQIIGVLYSIRKALDFKYFKNILVKQF